MNNASLLDIDNLFLVVFPYLAFAIFFLVTIQRYRSRKFTYSSLSSQFLENQHHFWGLVPFHYGIIVILTGHVVGFLLPNSVLVWNSVPLRLYVLEISAFVFALLTGIGLVSIVIRRLTEPKITIVTTSADWVLLGILLVQIFSGLYVAIFHGWGTSWFAATITPYLWSMVTFSPNVTFISAMPWMVKLHIICAYSMIAFFPFTRLVHVLVVPNPYLWRKPQVVRWYGIKRLISGK